MTITREKYLTSSEMAHLRSDAGSRHYVNRTNATRLRWLCVDIALQTGLRVSEMTQLTVGDIDLRASTLSVIRSKRRSGPTRETIAMSASLKSHLLEHLMWMQTCDRNASIWRGQRGSWGVRGLQQAWARSLELAGLPPISIHGARHTLAVHLYQSTKNLRLVQKQLGHRSPDTTAEYYADCPFEQQLTALQEVFG